jgi:hypothetical protein
MGSLLALGREPRLMFPRAEPRPRCRRPSTCIRCSPRSAPYPRLSIQALIFHHVRRIRLVSLNDRPPAMRTKQPPRPLYFRSYALNGASSPSIRVHSDRASIFLGRPGHASGPSDQSDRSPFAWTTPSDVISIVCGLKFETVIKSSSPQKPRKTLTLVLPRQRASSDSAKPA